MPDIKHILSATSHRPFDYPPGKWIYYQEWNNALFLHWEVPFELLRPLVPESLHLDAFNGVYYISLVAFTMQKIRPRNLPAVSFISDFDEIKIRTYIDNDQRKGVYFLNIEAQKPLSVWIAKLLSGLPYEQATMRRTLRAYKSGNARKGYHFHAEFETGEKSATPKTELDKWLTERYCLYLHEGIKIYQYDIHHREWELRNVALKELDLSYRIGYLQLNQHPDLVHYSDGVKVLAWRRSNILPAYMK